MSLQYIIDGYNITNHPLFSRINKKDTSVHISLVTFIISRRLTGSPKNKATIVFDGYPAGGYAVKDVQSFNILFSRKITADELIEKIVESLSGRKNIIVVSDDREIRFAVKSLGARCIGVEEFIGKKERKRTSGEEEAIKAELNFTQKEQINKELRSLWLRE